ncbi:MAG: molybdate ABC transporter substrate-binding protein [Proteobacteria bacterium]|nr:molybdate ABC transporter substrate-binding protein [Pseudomonadota bacterium]
MSSRFGFFICLFLLSGYVEAAEVRIAVASNFKYTLHKLAAEFKIKTGHEIAVISASTGKLYAQIKFGAPYDVFLSADERRADLLVAENFASADSAYIYALGKLVMVSNIASLSSAHSDIDNAENCKQVLSSESLQRLAIANPKIAPYGSATRQVLVNMGLWRQLQTRIIMGENISQTFQFVSTKNADVGFVAQSMIEITKDKRTDDVKFACQWDVPTDLYSPIKQKMVVLKNIKNKQAAHEFSQYIKSSDARRIIEMTGYDTLAN